MPLALNELNSIDHFLFCSKLQIADYESKYIMVSFGKHTSSKYNTVCPEQCKASIGVVCLCAADSVNIKILNAGAWSRSSEKVFVSLPTELEDLIPEVEDFYKKNHSGRKLHWHHLMSNGIVSGHKHTTSPPQH